MAAYSLQLAQGQTATIVSTGGGASPKVIGFNLPADPRDSVDCFIQDTLKSGHNQNDCNLVRALCNDSMELIPILEGIGFVLDRENGRLQLRQPLGSSYPRVAGAGNHTGATIMAKLRKELEQRGNVNFLNHHRAVRLMVKNDVFQGALLYDTQADTYQCIQASAVILAYGGFCKIYPFSTNTKDIGGDGIAMAYTAGLSLVDLEFIQFEPTAAVYPMEIRGDGVSTTLCHEGGVIRNSDGVRFMPERCPEGELCNKDKMSKIIYEEMLCGKTTPHGGVYFDVTGVGAKRLKKAYHAFIQRYGAYGIDITKEYMEVAPAPHTALGGIRITPDCATNIPGIFACGEAIGGLHGANRIGGNAGLETIVFGRRAGRSATAYLANCPKHEPMEPAEWADWIRNEDIFAQQSWEKLTSERMDFLRTQMQSTLMKQLNVIRNGDGLAEALKVFKTALDEVTSAGTGECAGDAFKRLELLDDLTAAYLLALCAQNRTETVGCHIRSDSAAENSGRYRIIVRRGKKQPKLVKESF